MHRTGFHTTEDGTDIWFRAVGEGDPVVLCDGLACDGFIWRYLIDALTDDYLVVRWHYRGHGHSSVPDTDEDRGLDLATFSRDLRGLLDQLDIDDAALVGHSMGVQFVLEYFRRHIEAVRGLALVCGNYKRPLETFHGTDLAHDLLPHLQSLVDASPETAQQIWQFLIDSPLARAVTTLSEVNPRLVDLEDVDPYLEHAARMDLGVFGELLANVAEHSAEDLLPDVDVPTLVIAGEHDTFTPLHRSREMADRIPEGRLVVIPGGTHVCPLEAPGRVNRQVRNWLDECDG